MISTYGIVPRIYEFVKEHTQYNPAVSLCVLSNELRDRPMLVNRAYPPEELMEAIQYYARENSRRLMFGHILLRGINDQKGYVAQLAKLLKGLNAYVNLIPYSVADENGLQGVDHVHVTVPYDALMKQGVRCTICKEYGAGIDATRGQPHAKHLRKKQEGSRL